MSGKNRAFALVVATAALIGLSAPMASAATSQGGPGGFSNDSVLNATDNQLSSQTCTGGTQNTAATTAQTVATALGDILPTPTATPTISTGTVAPTQANNCTQSPTQILPSSTAPVGGPNAGPDMHGSNQPDSEPSFNNDSVIKLYGNQLNSLTCTGGVANTASTIAQVIAGIPVLTTGAVSPAQVSTCTQSPSQGTNS
jgi:hypothetical protein